MIYFPYKFFIDTHLSVWIVLLYSDTTVKLLNTQKRLAKEARFQETQAKNAALGKKVKDTPAARGKGRGEASFFRVTCKVLSIMTNLYDENLSQYLVNNLNVLYVQDNGRGMPHEDIPNMFGRGKQDFNMIFSVRFILD